MDESIYSWLRVLLNIFLPYLAKKDKLTWKCDPIYTAVLREYPERDADDNVNEVKDYSKSHLES